MAALGSGAIGNSVFIHNLLFEITSGQLREVFSLAGQVLDVEMRNKISIANLPLTVTTQTIRDLFERAGDVDYVQLSDGGRCDVEFFSEYSAAEAIAKFDKYLLDQSEIRVFRT